METLNIGKAPHKLVLLVDDSTIDNYVNQKMIERHNFSEHVIPFTKTIMALDYIFKVDKDKSFGNGMPSIIFLDLNMPRINGFEFIQIFNKLSNEFKNNCKIIILSSFINDMDLEPLKNNKYVLASLSKPLMKKSFDLIEELLNSEDSEEQELRKRLTG